jgi:hypothetical protein
MKINRLTFNTLLKKKYLTQKVLAEKIGTTQANISQWIVRERIPDKYEDGILEILNVTSDELKGIEKDPVLFSQVSEPSEFYSSAKNSALQLFNECEETVLAPESLGCIDKNDFLGVVNIPLDEFERIVSGKKYLIKTKYADLLRNVQSIDKKSIVLASGEYKDTIPIENIKKIQIIKCYTKKQ